MYIFMKISRKLFVLVAAAMVVSCAVDNDVHTPVIDRQQEAQFAIPTEATRTMIGEDGKSTYWVVGDKLALWAKDSSGNFVAEGVQFMLHHFSTEYTKAYFSGNIAEQAEDNYTYYMCSPMPNSVEGTTVSYTLPAVQDGIYNGAYDIMVARTVEAGAITSSDQVEFGTTFLHQMHALKITVPEGGNSFVENSNTKFYSLEITFPTPVVGDVNFDVTTPDTLPTYTNTSNTIVVRNEEGFDVGSEIWVFVLPGSVEGDVSYYVRGERRRSNTATPQFNRDLKRGSITPIKMNIPEIYPLYTAIHFSVDKNYLGEDFNHFEVYNSNGENVGRFERNAQNKYTLLEYEGEFDVNQYDNLEYRIVFDSNNAIVETKVNLGNLENYTESTIKMDVPYLFFEDFSGISYSDGHDNPSNGSNSDTYKGISELSSVGLKDWYAARVGISDGAARILCRYENAVWVGAYYKGRLYTPFITGLKDGKSPNIKITYNYSGNISEKKPTFSSKPNKSPLLYFGLDTQTTVVNMDDADLTAVVTGGGYKDQAPTSLAIKYIDGETLPKSGGSYTSVTNEKSITVNTLTNSSRLAWIISTDCKTSNTNGNYWMYIDNIRLQIVP